MLWTKVHCVQLLNVVNNKIADQDKEKAEEAAKIAAELKEQTESEAV